MMKFEAPILPQGFSCLGKRVGIRKKQGPDLMVIMSERVCPAAAVFTKHSYRGACVDIGRAHVRDGRLQGIVVVSGIANVATGEQGTVDGLRMCEAVAAEFGVAAENVLPSATGLIGPRLPIDKIVAAIGGCRGEMGSDPMPAAEAIMTSDRAPKAVSLRIDGTVWLGICKGAGMIEPNMATMLVYILTDAKIESEVLQRCLSAAADKTFNMMSIDTDTSTSDTVAVMAGGCGSALSEASAQAALDGLCGRMVDMILRGGEGATRVLSVEITGAADDGLARKLAKLVINSPLVKTMVHGCDPNVGRFIMAIGKACDDRLKPENLAVSVNGNPVVRQGGICDFSTSRLREDLGRDSVLVSITVGNGPGHAVAFGCDMGHGYIDENAAYASS